MLLYSTAYIYILLLCRMMSLGLVIGSIILAVGDAGATELSCLGARYIVLMR